MPHLGYGFALYMEGMARKKRGVLCGGSYITRLAKGLGVFSSLTKLTEIFFMLPFNLHIMRNIGIIEKRDGQYVLLGDALVAPDAPAPPTSSIPLQASVMPLATVVGPSSSTTAPSDLELTILEMQHT